MTIPALLQTLANIGVRLEKHGGGLRVIGPPRVITAAMRQDLKNRRAEILAILSDVQPITAPPSRPASDSRPPAESWPLVEDGRLVRWRKSDEFGCRPCKRCGAPFVWGKVIEDTDPKAKRGAWMKLDPDLMPHGCGGPRAGRFIDLNPKATDGATTNDDK